MARGFNLTAEINLRGPSNIRTVVADIRRQLGTVTANVNLNVNPSSVRTINSLNQSLTRLNTVLRDTRSFSNQAVTALNSLSTVGTRVSSSISTLPRNVQAAAAAVNTLTRNTNASAQATQRARTEFEEFGRQSALAVRRFAAFTLGTAAIVKLNNAISSGVREFIAFDKELVRVSQVTGTSVKNLDSLVGQITSLSTSLGVTSEDLISVSSTLAQAGLSARDTEKALKALALSALAPSFDSLKDTVEGSIALMRQFGISAGDLEKALGSVNAVAAKFAVESGDIITAIQRTGGVFAAASRGVSGGTDALNEFIAVFTSVRATTRESAETIATGLRTIFTRIQRGDTIDALKQYGVVLTDLEGKFVGPYEAVRRLAEGLNQLDPRDLRFSRIVEELGGFRQIGKVIPLIQQFTTAQQALIVAQRGQGSLATDAAIAQQALANKISKVREEFVSLIRSVSQSQSFQNFIDLSLNLTSALIGIADAAKSVLPAITAITAIRGASFLAQFATGFYGGMRRPNTGGARGNANGGMIRSFANGGEVPVVLMPGEAVIYPEQAKRIGAAKLNRMNYADKRMAKGGRVGIVPGSGNTDSFHTSLPVGSYVIRKKATEAMGINTIADIAKGKKKYARGGIVQLNRLSPGSGQSRIDKYIDDNPNFKKRQSPVQSGDIVSSNITRIRLNENDIGGIDNFRQSINRRTGKLGANSQSNKYSLQGIAFENWIWDNIPQIKERYSRAPNKTYPLDLIPKAAGVAPAEIKFTTEQVPDPFILNKRLRYNLLNQQLTESGFTPKIDKNVNFGKTIVYELADGLKDKIFYGSKGPSRSAIKQRAERKQQQTSELLSAGFKPKNLGGAVQKFMAGTAVKAVSISPASLLSGPGGIGNWAQLRDDLLRKKGLTLKDGNLIFKDGQSIPFKKAIDKTPNAQVRTALAGAGIDGSVLRAELEGLYSGRRGAVVEATRPRTPQEVSAAQQKSLLFGAAGMYGKRFPATPISLTQQDGLKQPTQAVVFGALLDRDAAEKQSRLKKREIMLQASGVAGGRNTGTTEIEAAPTSKGLSKFFGYEASVKGVSKANKKLAIDTVNAIATTLSPGTQGSQIFLDFDRTLAFGADKIAGKINKKAPDYSAFSNLKQVAGGLRDAKLSGLGLRLRKLVANLDNKSPGLGNELLRRMFVVSARPQQTMPLIARWTRNQGLRIPPGNFSGVGGEGIPPTGVALAKAEKISTMAAPGSVFIDDDKKNIAAARDKGLTSIQYGSSISKKAKRQAAQQEGLQFEQFISEQLPASLKTGIFGTSGEGIDFPFGLGSRIANYWFKDPRLSNIPVDTKRTVTSASTIKDNVVSYLKDNGYASGGYIQKLAKAGKVKQPPEDNYYGQPEVEAARKAWRSFKRATRKAFADDQVYIETQVPKSISASGGIDIPESEKLYGTGIDPKLPKGTPAILGSKRIRPSRAAAAAPAAKADLKELARVKKLGSEQDQLAAGAFKPLLDEIAKKNPQAAAALASGLSKPGTASGFLLGQGLGGVDKKLQSEYASTEESISAFKSSGKLDISSRFASFFRSNLASMLSEAKSTLGGMDPQKAGYKQLRQHFNNLRNVGRDFQSLTKVRPGQTAPSKSSIDVQGRRTMGSQVLNKILEENFQGFASGGFADRVKSNIMSKQLSGAEMIKAAKQVGYKLSELDNGMIEFIQNGQVFHTFNRQQASEFLHSRLTGGYAGGGEVPIMAQKGEYVINRKSARAIGYENLHALNKYHTGGIVGSPQKLAKGGPPQKLAEAVGSFDAVSKQAAQALAQAMKTAIAQEFKKIRTNNPTMSANDALQKARANVQPVTNFGAFRAAETGDQNAANMVADAQRKQVNAIIKQIRAADSSVGISQAKAAAERRVADAWGGLYKRTKEQEQQASLLSRAMARVSGLYGKIRGSDLTPEQREARQGFRDRVASAGMGLAFTAPMLADQAAQMVGGSTGQALSAATSSASTFAAIGTQLMPLLGPAGPFALLAAGVLGAVSAIDSWNKALIESEIEVNKTKIEKENQKAEKTLATLNKDPKNLAATQELIKSLDAMSAAEKNIQDSRTQLRTQPTMMGRLKSLVGYDTTTPEEVQNNKEYQTELKKLQERNLNATEFAAEKRELVAKFTAQEVGQANAAQSRARSEAAMQALVAKGSQGLTIDEALGSFGSDAGKIQESIAAGSQKYAVELEKLIQDAATSGLSSAEVDKRRKALVQKYYLEETETLRAAMADQARAKAANKVAKALNTAVTSIERTFGNMEAALGRGADALSRASASLDAMAADKSNLQNAFSGQNVLENPRAYSRRERADAVRQSSGFFGQDAGFVEKLTSTVGSDIKDSLTAIATRAQSTGAGKEATAQEIQRSVDQQLMAAFGNNDLTRQLSEQIRIQLETQMKNDQTDEIDLDQLLAASTGLTSLIESEKKAFELLAQGTKQVSQALDIYTSKLISATEMLNEVDTINADSISMRASNDFRLREMLGQGRRVPVGERIAARSQEAAARAGIKPNQLNTASLVARLDSLRQARTTMEQQRSQFMEGKSFTDPDTMLGIQRFNAGLYNLDNQIAKTKNALKNLPKDIQGAIDDVAGAMEDRLSKIESKREAGGNLAERVVTSTPTELLNLNSTYNILNNALNGQARTIQQSSAAQMAYQKVIQDGGTAVEAMTAAQEAYANENKQVFSLFNELVAVGGIDKQQANNMRADLLETMARSQGLNMQNNPLFNQIIANLRRAPEEDPEIKRLQTLYKQLQETQQQAADATRKLVVDDAANLIKAAGQVVKTAIETARISFNEQQLSDIGLGLSRPGQVMNKADGGLIYASTGRLINFQPKGTDTVPAMLTPGEFVVNARATQQHLPLLQAINKSSGGPVQYFSAGTKKPVSMSRNASSSVNTPDQYRAWQDSVSRYGEAPQGNVRPNPARKPNNPTTRPVPYVPPNNLNALLFEQQYLLEKLDSLKDSDGKIRGRNIARARAIFNQIATTNREIRLIKTTGASSPWTPSTSKPSAAAANVAATPKPAATSAAPKPVAAATPKPTATSSAAASAAATPKPSTTSSSAASAAGDAIGNKPRNVLMNYDFLQPEAGDTGPVIDTRPKPKPGSGFFGNIMSGIRNFANTTTPRGPSRSSVLPTSAPLSTRLSASVGDLGEGAYRIGQNIVGGISSGANYVAQSVKPIGDYLGNVATYANAPYAGADAAEGLLPRAGRGAVRAARAGAYVASSATSSSVRGGLTAAGAGMAVDYALGAMGVSEGLRNVTSAAIDTGTTAYQGAQIGMGAAAQARIFAELGIQSAYEVGSAVYDTQAYIDEKLKQADAQQQAREGGYLGFGAGLWSNIWGNVFGTDASIYRPTTWIPGRGIPSAVGRLSVNVGDTARARQQAEDTKKAVEAKQSEMNAQFPMQMQDGTTRNLGVIGEQWVRRRVELEENRKKLGEEEYQKQLANLNDDRNAVDVTKGWFSNTSSRRMAVSNEDLDYAYGQEMQRREETAKAKEKAETEAAARKQEQAEKDGQRYYDSVRNTVQTGATLLQAGAQAAWNYGQNLFSAQQEAAAARENRINMHNSASLAMARPAMPEYVDKFKELAELRARLEKEYSELSAEKDDTEIVGPFGSSPVPEAELKAKREERKKQQEALQTRIDGINSIVVKQQRKGKSTPQVWRQKAWDDYNKAQAAAAAKANRDRVLADKRQMNNAEKQRISASRVLSKISNVPPPRDPERVPEWRAKSLEKIREKFNLSGDTEQDIKLMTAYGMSPELAKGLFSPLTESQNKAVYDVLAQQTKGGEYKYSDSDLQLLRTSRKEIMEKIASGKVPRAAELLERKNKLETAREKAFGRALKDMMRIDMLAKRGMSANNPRAQGRFRETLLKRLAKLGYIDPRENDAINAERLSALNMNSQTVSFIYPAQVGGMLAGKVDNAQQKSLGGVVYASTGKLISFQPRGTDTVPAMLTPGEFVVNAQATQQNLPLLQAINKAKGGQVSYYDAGGVAVAKSIGPDQASNIRSQQQSLAIQKQTADKLSAVNSNVQHTNKIATNIDNQKLPSLTAKTQNYQDTTTKGISSLSTLSNQNLTRTNNVANYLDKADIGSSLDANIWYSAEILKNVNRTNALLMDEQLAAGNLGGLPQHQRDAIGNAGEAAKRGLGEMFFDMFSRGGMVYASNGMLIPYKPRGTDTVPAMLTPGEFVVNKSATQANLPLLQAINGGARGFSTGGQVNYMSGGGILGQLFAPVLGSFKGLTSAVQLAVQALQTYQKQLASTQPNSVSNTSGIKTNLDGLSEFTAKFDQFITALNSINIPPMVNLQVAPVTVNITGAEALVAALEGPLGGMLQAQIAGAMNRLSAQTEGAIPT